jgi:hypothetical protein
MRLAALLIALVCFSGCGGVLVIEDRAPAPPRVVPAPHRECRDVCRDEAVDIALATAARRHGPALHLVEIRLAGGHWKVDLCGPAGHGYETWIRVKVDRVSGKVVSYKSKTRHVERHGRGHDRGHDS